ncbi:MAG: 5-(carboxyamino)imidazole ribonucleotide synthase [Elusimicrobia bacterium]|nr:MAG: 5-(carboxyamino)imidazole ribonucleotide synthase [Elusimicrobiota bacterium]KAF0152234.1 MAG: 5-(carboxyamino)imidazole ribonucleotide synthase [Elusimicrobiota bacterium]
MPPLFTVGILGGGQLGRMMALAARRLGCRVWTLAPEPDPPCAQAADGHIRAAFGDARAALRLAARCDLLTCEFENIPAAVAEAVERSGKAVHPGGAALKTAQDRLLEKRFLRGLGIPVADYREILRRKDLAAAAREIGFPAVLKTARGGYDGKGQAVVRGRGEAEAAFRTLGGAAGNALVWERLVPFAREIGVVCARNAAGALAVFPPAENVHRGGILHLTLVPAGIPRGTEARLRALARRIAGGLSLTGTFCVETFLLPDGKVLVNEIAPRPHNCGHYTLDACETSQFEQHMRAVCGLPLGSTRLLSPAAMVNILGTGAGDRLIGAAQALADPAVKLHLYGKQEAHAGRKMGHLTALGGSAAAAARRALAAHGKLAWARAGGPGLSAPGTGDKEAA